MTDLRDLSGLPADERYWDELEARIMADIGPRVRDDAGRGTDWWVPLAARSWRLGALAAAAAIAAMLLVPPRPGPESPAPTGILRPPQDDAAVAALLASPAPPALASLPLRLHEEVRDDR